MAAAIARSADLTTATARRARRPRTVGRVNDLAYGNPDGRLERTLAPLRRGPLRAYNADHNGAPARSRSRSTTTRTAASPSSPPPRKHAAMATRPR